MATNSSTSLNNDVPECSVGAVNVNGKSMSRPNGSNTSSNKTHYATTTHSIPATTSQFHIQVMSPSELSSHPTHLKDLMKLVNDAYLATHLKLESDLGMEPYSIFTGHRFNSQNQLVQELPEDSLIALMFDQAFVNDSPTSTFNSSHTVLGTSSYIDTTVPTTKADSASDSISNGDKQADEDQGRLVAVASIKRWKGTVIQKYYRELRAKDCPLPTGPQYSLAEDVSCDPDPEHYWDWEIATCTSLNEPRYRGMGLISQLNAVLLDRLQERRNAFFADKDVNERLPVRLWVSALGGTINKDYWIKRGYQVQGNVDTAPPGVWGNLKDIEIWTLSKLLQD